MDEKSMNIQWYPGHMTKTRRIMEEDLKLVDAVCEILDARIPISSRNPDIDTICGSKPRMIMYEICKAKFRQNPDLAERLISTSDFELIEGNNWGDHIWGVCDGYGENRLGKILMRIREELIHG